MKVLFIFVLYLSIISAKSDNSLSNLIKSLLRVITTLLAYLAQCSICK
jgi:hypothetical protein